MSRVFLPRLALAFGGMFLFCVAMYVGLGWIVWSQQPRLMDLLGKQRFWSLSASYARVAGKLSPGDQDSDGTCDGYELFRKYDPLNAKSHPSYGVHWDISGIVADARSDVNPFKSTQVANDLVWCQAGSRRRLSGWLTLDDHLAVFPRGFHLALTPGPNTRLAAPGGVARPGTMDVPVKYDGFIAFDVERFAGSADHLAGTGVTIANATTGESLGHLIVRRIWEDPPVPATAREQGIQYLRFRDDWGRSETFRILALQWPPISQSVENVIIEAARDDDSNDWLPIAVRSSSDTSCAIRQFLTGPFQVYDGPLRFRVVPIHYTAP